MKTMIVICTMALAVASCNCNGENSRAGDSDAAPDMERRDDGKGVENTSGGEKTGSRYDTIYLDETRQGLDSEVRKDTLNDEDGTTGGVDSTHKRSGGKGTTYP